MDSAVAKYVALRQALVTLHGAIGRSPSGAELPKMTYADRFVFVGVMAGVVTESMVIKARAIDPSRPIPERALSVGSTAGAVFEASGLNATIYRNAYEANPEIVQLDEKWSDDSHHVYSIPILNWVWGRHVEGAEHKERRFVLFDSAHKGTQVHYDAQGRPTNAGLYELAWYLFTDNDADTSIAAYMTAWDPLWTEIYATPETTGPYLSLAETVRLWNKAYALLTSLPAAAMHWDTGANAASVWSDVKSGARDALKEGGAALGEAAGAIANTAGEVAGQFGKGFFSSIGLYGIAAIVAVIYLKKFGVF